MELVIATHNAKKREEMDRILRPLGIRVAADRPLPEVEETGATFEENAYLKAASACAATGLPAVADDSGLMVDALDGAPGVYSARYGGEGAGDAANNDKLLREMAGVPETRRGAHFVSAICCVFPDGRRVEARGECPGRIAFAPEGDGGFGYDPLFLVEGGRSYAQLTAGEKDEISHRGRAMRLFATRLEQTLKERI